MIGKTYLRLKNNEKAAIYLAKARDYPAASAEDIEVVNPFPFQKISKFYPNSLFNFFGPSG